MAAAAAAGKAGCGVGPGLRGLLDKLAFRQAVGVYVGDHEVTVSRVALGLAGPVELSSRTEPCEPEDLGAVLARLLKPLAAARKAFRPAVSIGLPTLRVFFATKALQSTDHDAAPGMLLHEVLRSSNVNVDEMEVDLIKAQPGKKPLALLVAGRRKYLAGLLAAVTRCGFRPLRAEPAPFALVRLAAARWPGPRRARTVVRVFLGDGQGVAVLVAGEQPLSWRVFELPPGGEAAAVRSTAKAVQIIARFRGDIGAPDAVLVHGRPDLAGALGAADFLEALGPRSRCFPGPGYDPSSIALGLAIGCRQGVEAFDLSRALKPKAPFWQVFPVGDVAMQVALLACVTLFLDSKVGAARRTYRTLRAEAARHAWLGPVADDALRKEKTELGAKVEAVRGYLETRILWSAYTRDLSARLPETILMSSFDGLCEFEPGKRARPKKLFSFKLSTPISRGQGLPREIDGFLNGLRRDALLRRDFPDVKLSDLRWNPSAGVTRSAVAEFTVNCRPAPERPRPAPPAAAH